MPQKKIAQKSADLKAKGKAIAKAEPPKKEAPPAAMDKKDVSRMLGYIKYHARPDNKNEEGKRDAEECLRRLHPAQEH